MCPSVAVSTSLGTSTLKAKLAISRGLTDSKTFSIPDIWLQSNECIFGHNPKGQVQARVVFLCRLRFILPGPVSGCECSLAVFSVLDIAGIGTPQAMSMLFILHKRYYSSKLSFYTIKYYFLFSPQLTGDGTPLVT